MKKINKYYSKSIRAGLLLSLLGIFSNGMFAQNITASALKPVDDSTATEKTGPTVVKNTFDGSFIIDNQTVKVSKPGTFEFDIQHRFGLINNGYKDFFGLFAPSNIRLGFVYTPIKNLSLGIGITKSNMVWDGSAKYAILRQMEGGGSPVSVTYFGNFAVDTREKKGNFVDGIDRMSYFHSIMVARKITSKFSVQISGSVSYFNNIPGLLNSDSTITPKMNNAHFAIAFMGRYKVTDAVSVILNYDQPLTQHNMNNPRPNVSFGVEMGTVGHTFQIFFGNYQNILQQYNNLYNQNNYIQSRYVIGFNLSRG